MQTFLPYANYSASAACLDSKRLGKQRVECLQIARTLIFKTAAWQKHPAVKMWKGYERELLRYGYAVCAAWIGRGYLDTVNTKLYVLWDSTQDCPKPWWLGTYDFHASHRAALLHKLPRYYEKYNWLEKPSLDYWWPTHHEYLRKVS